MVAGRVWYSVKYGVGFDDVHTDARPNDCDFIYAPLGDKGCSYKAHVQLSNADDVLVAGDNPPIYANDTKTAKLLFLITEDKRGTSDQPFPSKAKIGKGVLGQRVAVHASRACAVTTEPSGSMAASR